MPKIILEHYVYGAVAYKLTAVLAMIKILLLLYFSGTCYINYHLSTSKSAMDYNSNLLGLSIKKQGNQIRASKKASVAHLFG